MACRRIVKLRRGLLLWPLVGPTRTTARLASVSSTEVSENRILGSNAYSHCQPFAVENREAIRRHVSLVTRSRVRYGQGESLDSCSAGRGGDDEGAGGNVLGG